MMMLMMMTMRRRKREMTKIKSHRMVSTFEKTSEEGKKLFWSQSSTLEEKREKHEKRENRE
jgi:hypothetical protein